MTDRPTADEVREAVEAVKRHALMTRLVNPEVVCPECRRRPKGKQNKRCVHCENASRSVGRRRKSDPER